MLLGLKVYFIWGMGGGNTVSKGKNKYLLKYHFVEINYLTIHNKAYLKILSFSDN